MQHTVTITKGISHLFAECTCGETKVSESAFEIRKFESEHESQNSNALDRAEWMVEARRIRFATAKAEAARRNQAMFGTDPSWYA